MAQTIERSSVGRMLGLAGALLLLTASPEGVVGQSRDPFEAMGVERPAKPFPAPDLAFTALDGRVARLGDLRGKVVLLGFFTST